MWPIFSAGDRQVCARNDVRIASLSTSCEEHLLLCVTVGSFEDSEIRIWNTYRVLCISKHVTPLTGLLHTLIRQIQTHSHTKSVWLWLSPQVWLVKILHARCEVSDAVCIASTMQRQHRSGRVQLSRRIRQPRDDAILFRTECNLLSILPDTV